VFKAQALEFEFLLYQKITIVSDMFWFVQLHFCEHFQAIVQESEWASDEAHWVFSSGSHTW